MPQIIHQDGFDVGSQLPPVTLGVKTKVRKAEDLGNNEKNFEE